MTTLLMTTQRSARVGAAALPPSLPGHSLPPKRPHDDPEEREGRSRVQVEAARCCCRQICQKRRPKQRREQGGNKAETRRERWREQ